MGGGTREWSPCIGAREGGGGNGAPGGLLLPKWQCAQPGLLLLLLWLPKWGRRHLLLLLRGLLLLLRLLLLLLLAERGLLHGKTTTAGRPAKGRSGGRSIHARKAATRGSS